MIETAASRHVPAPPHAVFAFMNVPENHARITPAMTRSEEIGRMPDGGARAAFVYRIAGVPLRGTVEATGFVPDRHIAFAMEGDLAGTIRLDFEEEDGGTRVVYRAAYDLPGSRLLRTIRPLVAAVNEQVLKTTLANLARAFEPGGAQT